MNRFLDEWTKRQMGFAELQAAIRPHGLYGRLWQQTQLPFVAGDEEQWRRDRADLEALARLWTADEADLEGAQAGGAHEEGDAARAEEADVSYRRVANALAALPDIDPTLAILAAGDEVCEENLAMLKRFSYFGHRVFLELGERGITLLWFEGGAAMSVLRLLQPEGGLHERFALSDLGDKAFNGAENALLSARRAHEEAAQRVARSLREDYGAPVRGDQTLSLPVGAEALSRARTDRRLRLRFETPFEVLYDVDRSSDDTDARELRPLEDRAAAARHALFGACTAKLRPLVHRLQALARALGRLDEGLARIRLGRQPGFCWPELAPAGALMIGASLFGQRNWVPIDIRLSARATILTGPNMGGKTAALKTALQALACLHYGYPAQAASMRSRLFRALAYVGGELPSVSDGLSSFGAEVSQLADAWKGGDAFICVDEFGRSTNPMEGWALARGLAVAFVRRAEGMLFFATHFALDASSGLAFLRVQGVDPAWLAELSQPVAPLPERLARLREAMDYTIVADDRGHPPSDGLRVAAWLGLAPEIVFAAEALRSGGSKDET